MPASADYPFKHAGPVSPERLIDREDELRKLGLAAGERTPIRLAAPRRYGKTSLLAAHARLLEAAGWRTVLVDFAGVTDVDGVLRALLAAWSPHRERSAVRRVERFAGRLGFELSATGPRLQLAPAAATSRRDSTLLEDLLQLPDTVATETATPTLVVFDEFQDLLVAGPQLDARVRSVIQHQTAAAYVFAGSEPSLLARMFERHEAPFYGQAEPLGLGPLPLEETITAVEARFAELELEPGDAAATMVVFGDGHPQRTMLLCHLLARRLQEPPELEDDDIVDAVLDDALEQTAEIHAASLAPLSRTQRVVLGEIAHGRRPTQRDLPRRQQASRAAFQQAADTLVADGQLLARTKSGAWRIIDPLLRLRLAR